MLVVGLISIGPSTLFEGVRDLTYVRPAPAPEPISPPSLHPDPELQARLDGVAAALSQGSLSASVVDLRSGATASVDGDRAFPAASLFKLPILVTVLSQEDAGLLDDDDLLEIRPEDWTDGSGVLQARVGERLPVHELLRLMVQESDNIAALVLLDAVGVDQVNATCESLGLSATHLVDHRRGDSGEHTTSADDMSMLLRAAAIGELVNPRVSERTVRLLELKQANAWLSEELPFWVRVAHKWGDLPTARNDVGIVYTPRGSFVVAVLSRDGQPEEVEHSIARAARTAYDFLGHNA